jgi:hypothetical protein
MGTRSIIGYPTESGFEGYYVHYDGYPSGVGAEVYALFNDLGQERFNKFLECNPDGFSYFPRSPYAYEPSQIELTDHVQALESGCEYAYILNGNLIHIYSAYSEGGGKMIGMFGQGDRNAHWNLVFIVDMRKPVPDWETLN